MMSDFKKQYEKLMDKGIKLNDRIRSASRSNGDSIEVMSNELKIIELQMQNLILKSRAKGKSVFKHRG
jgi:hypothetical protein